MTPPRPWRTAHASVAGTAHLARGLPCQDAGRAVVLGGPDAPQTLLACVADGAGSAPRSAEGAALAVSRFLREAGAAVARDPALAFFGREFARDWLAGLRGALAARAAEAGCGVQDFACTFLGAVVGEARAGFLQIGDGAIVVADAAGQPYRWVFWPQHGEFANSTLFVTQDDAADLMLVASEAGPLGEVALFSDGMERLVLDFAARAVHAPALRPIFRWLAGTGAPLEAGAREEGAQEAPAPDGPAPDGPAPDGAAPDGRAPDGGAPDDAASAVLRAYLGSAHVSRRTDDDKTLVMASRAAGPAPAPEPAATATPAG